MIQRSLDPSKRVFLGRLISNFAKILRVNFADYIGKIGEYQDDALLWYSSRMASKSVSQSSMFQYYLYCKVAESLASSGKDSILLTDNPELLRVFGLLAIPGTKVFGGIPALHSLRDAAKRVKHSLRLAKYVFFWIFLKIFYKKPDPNGFRALIYSWIEDSVFSGTSTYNDRFFPGLEGFCSGKGLKTGRFTVPFVSFRFFLKLRKHFDSMMLSLGYLDLKGLFTAFTTKFKVFIPNVGFEGINDRNYLDILLGFEERSENNTKVYRIYLLFYHSFLCLSRRFTRPIPIIYMFENQPFEKMLNLAFKDNPRIGYQHTIIPGNWLDYHLSAFEKNVPLPTLIITSGKRWTEILNAHFSDRTKIIEGGALRYKHIMDVKARNAENGDIVVALPAYADVARSLQEQMLKTLDSDKFFSGFSIKIKTHPFLPDFAVMKRLFDRHANCGFTLEPVSSLLDNCRLLITSATTVAYESVICGIKTVYLIPESFSDGTEQYIREHLNICFENDFTETVKKALTGGDRPSAISSEYFSKPDYNVFYKSLSGQSG